LSKLDTDEINIGEDCDNASDLPEENHFILGDQKLDYVLGKGKNGSVICKGSHKVSH
jgi:hypothetical protein